MTNPNPSPSTRFTSATAAAYGRRGAATRWARRAEWLSMYSEATPKAVAVVVQLLDDPDVTVRLAAALRVLAAHG